MASIFGGRLTALAISRKFRRRSIWRWIPVLPLTMLFLATLYTNAFAPPRASVSRNSSRDVRTVRYDVSADEANRTTVRSGLPDAFDDERSDGNSTKR